MPRTGQASDPRPVDLVAESDRAMSLLSPVRRRILACLRQPDSAAGVAATLGLPRQRVNYHVRRMEEEGLLEAVEERRKGNCVERIVRATATHYLIDPTVLGELAADLADIPDHFSSTHLVAQAARIIREVACLREGADAGDRILPTLSLTAEVRFGSPARQQEFAQELTAAVTELVARFHDDRTGDGRTFRLVVGSYPAPPHAPADAAGPSASTATPETRP